MTPPVDMTKGRAAPWVGRRPMTAPVEMTKGRPALPATVVAEQDPFFIALGGRRPLTSTVEMTKGRTALSSECGGRTEAIFHHLGWASGREDKGEDGVFRNSSC